LSIELSRALVILFKNGSEFSSNYLILFSNI